MSSMFLGIPIMRGQLEPETLLSLMALRRRLFMDGISHNIATNETCYLSYSRNGLMDAFLRTKHDFLMWIDSDMTFPEYGVTRLVRADKDVIGGVYYRKTKPHEPLVFTFGEDGNFRTWHIFPQNGIFRCGGLATGFLLIKRKVIEKLVESPERPFDLGRNPNTGKEEGEDITFCRKVIQAGFEVWCDPTIPLGHVGKVVYGKDDFDEAKQFTVWKYKALKYTNKIDGWMSDDELNWLYATAKDMESVVEIGSWKGKSTHALLSACPGPVWAVDHFKGSEDERESTHKEAVETDIYAEFIKNVGEFKNLNVLKMDSVEAAKQFEEKSVDMVFIDGDHRYENVKADIEMWLPKAKKLICGHDYNFVSVQEAVTEAFGIPDHAESIWLKELKNKNDKS